MKQDRKNEELIYGITNVLNKFKNQKQINLI